MMKQTKWSRISLLAGGLLAVIPVKCNSILEKSKPADEGYEFVSVSGSNIPLRVKKGEQPAASSQVEVYGAEAYRNMTQKTMQMGKANGP